MKKNKNFIIYLSTAGFAVFIALLLINDIRYLMQIRAENEKLKTLVVSEREKGRSLAKEIRALKNSDVIELVARERLGLIRKGETAYKVITAYK